MAIAAVVIASTSAEPGLEDARLPRAREQIPAIVDRYAGLAVALGDRLAAINNQARMAESVADSARRLWQLSTAEIQTGLTDDRALYWGRLALRAVVYRDVDPQTRPALLEIVEQHSRGLTDTQFPDDAKPRLLITGFDPFHLDVEIAQSNPSGLAALSLTGVMLASGDGRAHVKGALIPVRFNDFDDGLIEGFLTEHYRRNQLSLVVTISMGRDAFDLERFPGRRRSAESPDNANVYTGANETNPLIPLLGGQPLQGPEFVEILQRMIYEQLQKKQGEL